MKLIQFAANKLLKEAHDSDFEQVRDDIESTAEGFLSGVKTFSGKQIGLDPRAGTVYVTEHWVATKHAKSLDYYGGFEYVHDGDTIQVGNIKFYSAEDSHAKRVIELALDHTDEEDEDEDEDEE